MRNRLFYNIVFNIKCEIKERREEMRWRDYILSHKRTIKIIVTLIADLLWLGYMMGISIVAVGQEHVAGVYSSTMPITTFGITLTPFMLGIATLLAFGKKK